MTLAAGARLGPYEIQAELALVTWVRFSAHATRVSSARSQQRETYDLKMGENEMDLVSACCNPDPRSVNIPDSLGPW
jgi:hypothetical protein